MFYESESKTTIMIVSDMIFKWGWEQNRLNIRYEMDVELVVDFMHCRNADLNENICTSSF